MPERLVRYREYQTHIGAFGGLNVTETAAEGASYAHTVPNTELSAECNMTSEYYPAIGVRGERYERVIDSGNDVYLPSVEATYNDGLFYLCEHGNPTHGGSYAHYRGQNIYDWNLTSSENEGQHSFVNMGAYIIIMPEGVWFDTVKAQEYINGIGNVTLSDFAGKIEITKTQEEYSNTLMYPCFSDGTVASSYPSNVQFPAEYGYSLDLGVDDEIIATYNSDKSDIFVYRYQKNTAKYTLENDKVFKLSATGIGVGFVVGECVELTDIKIKKEDTGNDTYSLDFGIYGKILACDNDSLTVRFANVDPDSYVKFCNRWTHEGMNNSPFVVLYTFTLSRPMPDMKFITEWNNRLWGCGGDKNNTIFASALGDPRSWSLFENTAADSYYANVDSTDEWTGAVTFYDHAYFFKGEKCYKMYGSRPANFSYQKLDFGLREHKSICVLHNRLYFARYDGIYASSGTAAYRISDTLGSGDYFNCVGFGYDKRLYMRCTYRDDNGNDSYHLYTFDIDRGIWHDESMRGNIISSTCNVPDDVLVVDSDGVYCLGGTFDTLGGYSKPTDDGIAVGSWYFDTQDFQVSSVNAVYISRLQVNLSVEMGAVCHIRIMYDNDGMWRQAKSVSPHSRYTVLVPLAPRRSRSFKIRFEGVGNVKVYGITYSVQGGSEYYGKC